MQLLCIAALLLAAVAAQPGSQKPWQDRHLLPAGGRNADSKRGDDKQSVTLAPEDGEDGSGGDSGSDSDLRSQPTGFMSEHGRHFGHHKGNKRHNGTHPVTKHTGFMSEHGKHFGHHKGNRSKRHNGRNPVAKVFSPVFKVDNVTFQNVTDVTLKEGENIFLMPKHGGRGPHSHKGERRGPPKNVQVVKLIYNATEPNKVSVEFGFFKPMIGEQNNDEDY